jgi:hypothetical protein
VAPKTKMQKISPVDIQSFMDKARGQDGNIRLGYVKKLYKKNKKKQNKLGKLLREFPSHIHF